MSAFSGAACGGRPLLAGALLLFAACTSVEPRPPIFVGGPAPVYPRHAQRTGIEGYVVVEYRVTANGTVTDAVVVEAQPPGVFDAAALAAVRGWRFQPLRGAAGPAAFPRVRSQLIFTLEEPDDTNDAVRHPDER